MAVVWVVPAITRGHCRGDAQSCCHGDVLCNKGSFTAMVTTIAVSCLAGCKCYIHHDVNSCFVIWALPLPSPNPCKGGNIFLKLFVILKTLYIMFVNGTYSSFLHFSSLHSALLENWVV